MENTTSTPPAKIIRDCLICGRNNEDPARGCKGEYTHTTTQIRSALNRCDASKKSILEDILDRRQR